MKLTIGMASYKNFQEVWFTVQSLIMYQDLSDTEILIIDNFGDDRLRDFVAGWWQAHPVRYVRYNEKTGTAAPRNQVFAEARGQWVFCMDSHVLLAPGTVARLKKWLSAHPDCLDLLQGPMLYDDQRVTADSFSDTWAGNMWGVWRIAEVQEEQEPYEIPMMGLGLFGCRRDAWLGFNPNFRGFGGEEGYLHTKYRNAGRKTLCLPWLKWLHYFHTREGVCTSPHTPLTADIIHNYETGFAEVGLDPTPMRRTFGLLPKQTIKQIQIDPNGSCGSKCWFCPVAYIERPAAQVMPQSLFDKILDGIAEAVAQGSVDPSWTLWLSSYNDILLDPLLVYRLEALRQRGLRFSVLTNGIGLDRKVEGPNGKTTVIDALDSYRDVIAGFSINLPAGNPESYQKHTGNSSKAFSKIIKGISALCDKDPDHYQRVLSINVNGMHDTHDNRVQLVYDLPIGDTDKQVADLSWRLPGVRIFAARPLCDRAGSLIPHALNNHICNDQVQGCENGGNRLTEWLHINSLGQVYLCCQDYSETTVYADLNQVSVHDAVMQNKDEAVAKAKATLCKRCTFSR